MKFYVVTLFPEVIDAYTQASILGRAQREKILSIQSYQLRDYVAKTVGQVSGRIKKLMSGPMAAARG